MEIKMRDKRSSLWVRFNRLNIWNKLFVVAAICTIIALAVIPFQCLSSRKSKDTSELLKLYFDDSNVDLLKKRVQDVEFKKLQDCVERFFILLKQKRVDLLNRELDNILEIVPHDPLFRVYQQIIKDNRISLLFNGDIKIVKVMRWEQEISGDEDVRLYIIMRDEPEGIEDIKGPFVNNNISIIDFPFKQYIQFRIEGGGFGSFTFYPKSIRIGWAEMIREEGEFTINKNNIEYDSHIRF